MIRRLIDGSAYRIIKRFPQARALQQRLANLGWSAHVQATPEFFIHGHATPVP
jgi:hypothetical protein